MVRRLLRAGFTLLEVLLVLIILAVLAGLAMPAYRDTVEYARTAEALEHLTATRYSLMRFHTQNNTYVGATIPMFTAGTLDFNPNLRIAGHNPLFDYGFSAGPGVNTYVIRARRDWDACGAPPGAIMMDQTGIITKSGVYA